MRPHTSLFALGVVAVALHAAVATAQTPACPPSTVTVRRPDTRPCCTLEQGFKTGGGPLDPNNLGPHKYGSGALVASYSADNVGFVYSASAGLVDLGHVRDNADMTRWLYFDLNTSLGFLELSDSAKEIIVPKVPCGDPSAMLDLAMTIAYIDSWEHELQTWEDLTGNVPQDPSSFSPEDLVSNIIGIEVARRVIQAAGYKNQTDSDFNASVETVLSALMTELKAQPESKAKEVLSQVDGNWASGTPGTDEKLLRRNFDAVPWRVWKPGEESPPTPPTWLTPARQEFQRGYSQFLYLMKVPVKGSKSPVQPWSIVRAPGTLQIINTPTKLTCADLSQTSDVIQVTSSAGRFTLGQFTCSTDSTGRLTLTTFNNATAAIKTAWMNHNNGQVECGFPHSEPPVDPSTPNPTITGILRKMAEMVHTPDAFCK